MLAALWCVDEENVLWVFLLAALVHELGHLLVLYIAGGRFQKLSLTFFGAIMHCELPADNLAKAAVCLAGPASSFMLTAVAGFFKCYRLAGASVILGLFNLLPIPPLDGGMALNFLMNERLGCVRKLAALASVLLIDCGGIWLACEGGGCWLLIMGVALSLSGNI